MVLSLNAGFPWLKMFLCRQACFELCVWRYPGLGLSGVSVNASTKSHCSTLGRVPSTPTCSVSSSRCCLGRDGMFLCVVLHGFKLCSGAVSGVVSLELGFGRESCYSHRSKSVQITA